MLRDAQRGRPDAVLRARAAPAGRRPAAVPVARAAALRARSAGVHRVAGRRCSTTTPAIPRCTLDMYEDGDHIARRAAAATPRSSSSACARCFRDLPQPRFRRCSSSSSSTVYWRLPAARPERAAPGRELLLLRLRAPVVPDPHRDLDASSTTAAARGMEAGRRTAGASCGCSIVSNFGLLGFFKYFNFFVDNVAAALAALGVPVSPPMLRDRPAGRHLVLHVPGDELHDRRLPRRAARAAEPARRRGVRLVLPAPGRRADRARLEPAAAGRSARAASRSTRRDRLPADLLGLLQEAGHRRQRRRDRQQGVRAGRSRRSRCSGPACSPSRSRSTPTSPPTPTSRAARRAGSGSS